MHFCLYYLYLQLHVHCAFVIHLCTCIYLYPYLCMHVNEIDPWNPPEVASSLTDVGRDVLAIAEFMGYKCQELPVQQDLERKPILPVPKFLEVWKIPDCGEKTVEILDSMKRQTGFIREERQWIFNIHVVYIVYSKYFNILQKLTAGYITFQAKCIGV